MAIGWTDNYSRVQIEDFSLVQFVPVDSSKEESVADFMLQLDHILQYDEHAEVKTYDDKVCAVPSENGYSVLTLLF